MFVVVLRLFFKLIDDPELKNFNDFKDQRKSLMTLSYFYVVTFFLRSVLFATFGHYKGVGVFLKYEFYLLFSTILEVPNMFFLYMTHYRSFKKETP
jgi:hypothetical protein